MLFLPRLSAAAVMAGAAATFCITSFSNATLTTTVTTFSGPASTSYVFLPGQSPAAVRQRRIYAVAKAEPSSHPAHPPHPVHPPHPAPPPTSSIVSTTLIVSACFTTSIVTTATVTATTTLASAPVTKTVYPCATPLPNSAYGISSRGGNEGNLTTTTYDPTTSQGGSAAACCNQCYFGSQNCVQAAFHAANALITLNPLGCIITTAPQAVGDGVLAHETQFCPAGVIDGLYYTPDDGQPIFIPGPCGYLYENLN